MPLITHEKAAPNLIDAALMTKHRRQSNGSNIPPQLKLLILENHFLVDPFSDSLSAADEAAFEIALEGGLF